MKYYITILLFLARTVVYAQSFNFEKIKITAIDSLRKIEKGKIITHSYMTGVAEDYFPNRKQFSLEQPIIYEKQIKNFKNEISFYYTREDSVVRLIEYEWEGDDNATDSAYNVIVSKNEKIISTYFRTLPEKIPETETKAAKSIWNNELAFVQQLIMPGLRRIRVLVSWK